MSYTSPMYRMHLGPFGEVLLQLPPLGDAALHLSRSPFQLEWQPECSPGHSRASNTALLLAPPCWSLCTIASTHQTLRLELCPQLQSVIVNILFPWLSEYIHSSPCLNTWMEWHHLFLQMHRQIFPNTSAKTHLSLKSHFSSLPIILTGLCINLVVSDIWGGKAANVFWGGCELFLF